MAKSPTRATTGARTPPPAEVSNPTPEVGTDPNTPAIPEPTPDPAIEFQPPPALTPQEPADDAELVEVETTGPFMIIDPTNLKSVPHKGSAVMELTEFVKTALSDGRLKKA